MAARPLLAFFSIIFTAGGLLLMLLIILAGGVDHSPLNKFYFLQANTGNIPNAPSVSRWTYWNICGVINGRDICGKVHPAFPLDPPSHRNFGTTVHIPHQFLHTSKYFYLTRFMFAFELIALFFTGCGLLIGVLALCTRIASYLSGLLCFLGLLFQTIMCCLMTAAYVIGRDNFRSNGQAASVGRYAFGFEWAAMACLLIATSMFCSGGSRSKRDPTAYSSNRRSFFGGKRSKSTRSRTSHFDSNKEYHV